MPFAIIFRLCICAVLALSLRTPAASVPAGAPPQPTVIYLIRHAEKDASNPRDRDPALSPAGRIRSEALAQVLADVHLDAAIATEYRRTQQTIEPAATSHELSVTIAEAHDPAGIASRIRTDLAGKTVLIAGHSNTVPALLRAFGAPEPADLAETDYDDLFIVTLTESQSPSIIHLHYGAADMTDQAREQLTIEAATMLDTLHDAAAEADEERYFACFESGASFLGTDATERWTLDEFKAFAMPYFQRDSAWIYKPVTRAINLSDDGVWAWFDEHLHSGAYGRCRGTGVLHRTGGQWRLAQYHLSIPVPNEIAKDVVDLIREREDDGK